MTGVVPAAEQKPGTTHTLIPGVRRTVLPGGLRVVTETMLGVRSVAAGVFVGVGSRDETPNLSGASHFLEHLLFKGTKERSALEISTALDEVGGEFNAFTTKEYTCYHARVLDEDLPMAIDVLGDMLTSSLIEAEDVEAEREVILDEIAMHDDDPDDVVHNLFADYAWAGTPLGKPIAGRPATIRRLTRDQINRYYTRHYTADLMTVAVAGNLDHTDVVRWVRRAFSRSGTLENDRTPAGPREARTVRPLKAGETSATRPGEQVNLLLGMKGLARNDPRRHALAVVVSALGGGSSSRLFQEVRERRGLAYSIFAFASSYSDAGMVGVSAGCLPGRAEEVLEVARAELRGMAESGITEEELARAQGQLRGGLVLGLEDSASRMGRLGEAELFLDRLLSTDEVLERISAVTMDHACGIAREVFAQPETLAVVRP